MHTSNYYTRQYVLSEGTSIIDKEIQHNKLNVTLTYIKKLHK